MQLTLADIREDLKHLAAELNNNFEKIWNRLGDIPAAEGKKEVLQNGITVISLLIKCRYQF